MKCRWVDFQFPNLVELKMVHVRDEIRNTDCKSGICENPNSNGGNELHEESGFLSLPGVRADGFAILILGDLVTYRHMEI